MSYYIPELTAQERIIVSDATGNIRNAVKCSVDLLDEIIDADTDNNMLRCEYRKCDIERIMSIIDAVRNILWDAYTEHNVMLGIHNGLTDEYYNNAKRANLIRNVEDTREAILDIVTKCPKSQEHFEQVMQAVRDAMSKPDAEALPILKEYLASLQNAAKSE